MEELYKKSLQMIKILKIKDEEEYKKLNKYYFMLSVETLKFISGTRRFSKIVKLSKNENLLADYKVIYS